jgi:hypothetical protein
LLHHQGKKEVEDAKMDARKNMYHNIKQTESKDSETNCLRKGKPFATNDQVNHVNALIYRS